MGIDNDSAVNAIIRGRGKTKTANLIVAAIWRAVTTFALNIWVEYIRSKQNIADLPSRACYQIIPNHLYNAREVPREFLRVMHDITSVQYYACTGVPHNKQYDGLCPILDEDI